MNKEYEDIINMTPSEAAKEITNFSLFLFGGRGKGKSVNQLRINHALAMAVDALQDKDSLSSVSVYNYDFCKRCIFEEDCTLDQKREAMKEVKGELNNNPLSLFYNPSSCFQDQVITIIHREYTRK